MSEQFELDGAKKPNALNLANMGKTFDAGTRVCKHTEPIIICAVIVGGAIMGSSVAWFLTDNDDFDGSVLVVERDPSYEFSSTGHTNSCMRQQFSTALNVQISQFAADFVNNFGGLLRTPGVSRTGRRLLSGGSGTLSVAPARLRH